jgi:hypothetical protein
VEEEGLELKLSAERAKKLMTVMRKLPILMKLCDDYLTAMWS